MRKAVERFAKRFKAVQLALFHGTQTDLVEVEDDV